MDCRVKPENDMNLGVHSVLAPEYPFPYNQSVIIDCHTHIFPPEIKENRSDYIKDPCFAELYSDPKAKIATATDLIESMDRGKIDISVILNIGWQELEPCRRTNDYILESVSRYPKRLMGFCSIPLKLTDGALKELERCARGGVKGIGELRPEIETDFTDGNQLASFLEIMRKYNLILLTHSSEPVGHKYPGKDNITPDKLYSLIQRLPDVTIICAHFGGGLPFYTLMPEVKSALGRVYFDSAASPYLYSPWVFRRVLELVGKTRVLFGSDFPVISQERVLKDINSLELDDEARELILSGNAKRLFNIGGSK